MYLLHKAGRVFTVFWGFAVPPVIAPTARDGGQSSMIHSSTSKGRRPNESCVLCPKKKVKTNTGCGRGRQLPVKCVRLIYSAAEMILGTVLYSVDS